MMWVLYLYLYYSGMVMASRVCFGVVVFSDRVCV
jgi:hypothetical protein